ncbi:hypothetical protein F511_16628 [Dorcoceras hygrometricum]|uniref:Uncharacterized protein n=1 Tax=Dorcoceras hygrometricum TaxID=472368 RepID=A0A2Z7A1S0_9LAMI|nr:hypothetical protein F511_16628 [Dorcoceras hygrometricum]
MSCCLRLVVQLVDSNACDWIHCSSRLDLATVACDWIHFYDVASLLRLDVQATCWFLATAGLKPSADYDDVTDGVINAKPSADSSARRRFISFTSLLIC